MLTPVNSVSDDESVASVDTWGSQIDKALKKKTKRNKGKDKTTKKTATKCKVDSPSVSDYDMDTDSFDEMSNNEDLE